MNWKVIHGLPNYEISEDGIIRRLDSGKIIKCSYDPDGYPQHTLYFNGTRHYRKKHRLVAITFIPNPNNLPQINHIDGNKHNNHISNLEWCDQYHNMQHANRIGLAKHKKGTEAPDSKLNREQVLEIKELLKQKVAQTKIGKKFNVCQQVISEINLGKKYNEIY